MDDSFGQEPLAAVQDSAGLGQYVRDSLLHGNTPVSQVVQQLRLSTLDLSGYQLGMSGLQSLAAALGVNTSLRRLVLADCCLEDGAGAALQQLAASRLQFLDLSGNRLGLRCATALAAVLQQPGCSLLSLKLAGCLLGDKAGQLLVASLASASLAELQLAHNALGMRTATALGSCLQQNTSLLALDLSWNTLGPKGFAILADGLIASGQVQALDISLCGLQDSSANALAEVIADLTQLVEVAAAGNHFTASSADKLAEGLAANCQRSNKLLRLHLAGNLFKEAGCRVLIEVVKAHCQSLQELDISACHASNEQEADLKACLQGRIPAPVAEQPALEPVRPLPEDLTNSATLMKPIGAWPDRSP